MDFVTFGQSQARCFHLFSVFMLSRAIQLLARASYLTDRYESVHKMLLWDAGGKIDLLV